MSTTIDSTPVSSLESQQGWLFIKQTEELIDQHNRDHFEIGMRLMAIRDEKLYKLAGHSTFDLYLQSIKSKYDYERRTLYNFMKLHKYFVQELHMETKELTKAPYTRLLEIEKHFKDKPASEVKDMVREQENMPAYLFKQMKKEMGVEDKRPRMFQTPEGKWTIEIYKSNIHRITNLEDNTDLYHEIPKADTQTQS